MHVRAAQALVFATSAAVLVLEILAGRLMAPFVGVSLETFTGIIGTMLAGIALGSAVGGRLADRQPPQRLLGPTIVLGGLLAWVSLPVVTVAGPALGSGGVAIVLLAALAFFAPAAVLSATSPMVAKLQVDDLGETGTVVGGLSAAGTAGALVGTFVTGFVLVAAAPTRWIVFGVGLALLVLGAVLTVTMGAGFRPWTGTAVVLLSVLAVAAARATPCDFESTYVCGEIVTDADQPSLRYLVLDDVRHAAVDLNDPTALGFRYTRLLGDVVDAAPAGPLDVLHVGGGGFSMPRYVEATRPGSDNLALEIDEVLLDVARDDLGFETGPRMRVRIGDARLALPDLPDDGYDLVIGDAFSGASVPWHLTTTEFVAELDRVLRPGGIYAMNVIDGDTNRFARAALATLAEHFDHVAVIVPSGGVPARPVNQILVGSDAPLPRLDIDPADGRPAPDVDAFVDGARILTDDFAPADQLATR